MRKRTDRGGKDEPILGTGRTGSVDSRFGAMSSPRKQGIGVNSLHRAGIRPGSPGGARPNGRPPPVAALDWPRRSGPGAGHAPISSAGPASLPHSCPAVPEFPPVRQNSRSSPHGTAAPCHRPRARQPAKDRSLRGTTQDRLTRGRKCGGSGTNAADPTQSRKKKRAKSDKDVGLVHDRVKLRFGVGRNVVARDRAPLERTPAPMVSESISDEVAQVSVPHSLIVGEAVRP